VVRTLVEERGHDRARHGIDEPIGMEELEDRCPLDLGERPVRVRSGHRRAETTCLDCLSDSTSRREPNWASMPSANCCSASPYEARAPPRHGRRAVRADSLETELADRTSFRTRADARLAVFDYIEAFYNPRRRHSSLDYLSPADFERYRTDTISAA